MENVSVAISPIAGLNFRRLESHRDALSVSDSLHWFRRCNRVSLCSYQAQPQAGSQQRSHCRQTVVYCPRDHFTTEPPWVKTVGYRPAAQFFWLTPGLHHVSISAPVPPSQVEGKENFSCRDSYEYPCGSVGTLFASLARFNGR